MSKLRYSTITPRNLFHDISNFGFQLTFFTYEKGACWVCAATICPLQKQPHFKKVYYKLVLTNVELFWFFRHSIPSDEMYSLYWNFSCERFLWRVDALETISVEMQWSLEIFAGRRLFYSPRMPLTERWKLKQKYYFYKRSVFLISRTSDECFHRDSYNAVLPL